VHCIVSLVTTPERAISDFKAYASRALNRIEPPSKRWAREGNARSLPADDAVREAIRYVLDGQGETKQVYVQHRSAATGEPLRRP